MLNTHATAVIFVGVFVSPRAVSVAKTTNAPKKKGSARNMIFI